MKAGDRLYGVEMVRGVAALAVAWFHLTATHGGWAGRAGSLGWLGVDCFFVISGFVIPLALHRSGYTLRLFPAFMVRRLVRLEPPYLASIVLVVVLQLASALAPGFAGQAASYAPEQIALHLLYLVPLGSYPWMSPVYWSLGYEFVFYIAVGLLFPSLWRRQVAPTILLICGSAVVLGRFSLADPVRIPLFAMGIAAVRFHLRRDSVASFALALGCAAGVMTAMGGPLSAAAGAATALAVSASRATGRPTPWLGRISYSLYLTHVPVGGRVVNLGRRFVAGTVQELTLSLVALCVSLAFAAVFCSLVERPFVRLSRRVRIRIGETAAPSTPAP